MGGVGGVAVSLPNPEVLMRKLIVKRAEILQFLNFVPVDEVTSQSRAAPDWLRLTAPVVLVSLSGCVFALVPVCV